MRLPVSPKAVKPFVRGAQWFSIDGVETPWPVLTHGSEAVLPKHLQMLRDCRLGNSELVLHDRRHCTRRRLTFSENLEDPAPYRVSEDVECVHSTMLKVATYISQDLSTDSRDGNTPQRQRCSNDRPGNRARSDPDKGSTGPGTHADCDCSRDLSPQPEWAENGEGREPPSLHRGLYPAAAAGDLYCAFFFLITALLVAALLRTTPDPPLPYTFAKPGRRRHGNQIAGNARNERGCRVQAREDTRGNHYDRFKPGCRPTNENTQNQRQFTHNAHYTVWTV